MRMTFRLQKIPFGPDIAAVAQGLWVRRHSGGEAGFRSAMAEADRTAVAVLAEASRIIGGRSVPLSPKETT